MEWTTSLDERAKLYRRSGVDLSSEDKAIESQVARGIHWLDMGPIHIGGVATGEAAEGLIPDFDRCLDFGASELWRKKVAGRKHTIRIGDKTHSVRSVVGVGQTGEEESRYVWFDSPEAALQALRYLSDTIPGHVSGRVCLLAYHGYNLEDIKHALWAAICEVFDNYAEQTKEALALEMGG